jgi:hypothetical protein
MRSTREFTIGMFGPTLMIAGLLWELLDTLFDNEEGLQGVLSSPAHLLMTAGIIVALVCVPLAIHMATMAAAELRIHARLAAKRQEIRLPR